MVGLAFGCWRKGTGVRTDDEEEVGLGEEAAEFLLLWVGIHCDRRREERKASGAVLKMSGEGMPIRLWRERSLYVKLYEGAVGLKIRRGEFHLLYTLYPQRALRVHHRFGNPLCIR